MALTISEAAEAKDITRNAVWLAIKREEFTARKTSGGIWLIEDDEKWHQYRPRRFGKRSTAVRKSKDGGR